MDAVQRRRQQSLGLENFVAEPADEIEARLAMKRHAIPRFTIGAQAFVASCVSAAFLWTLALSSSPQLHARVHPDANRTEHTCAATLITSGSYDHGVSLPPVIAPVAAVQFSKIPALTPQWVESPFLSACVFEHAPPARS
jgi:hypothetical protein